MEFKPASSYSFSGKIPIQIDQDGWRSLLTNMETETETSQIYTHLLTNVKTALEEAAAKTEAQVKALGAEAIKLNLKNLTRTLLPKREASSKDLISSQKNHTEEPENSLLEQQIYEEQLIQNHPNQFEKDMSTNLTTSVDPEITNESISVYIDSEKTEIHLLENHQNSTEEFELENNQQKRKKRLTKAEQLALLIQERNTYLQQLGEKLRKARQMRCLSIKQIHKQTFVPLHYLQAMEKGQIEELPEDVYLRGFIFRIGNALGFDGAALAAELPISDPLQGLMPSWYKSNQNFGFSLNPVHLYVGYAALMAGAVSGLSWMSQQPPNPGAKMIPELPEATDAVAHSDQHLGTIKTPGLKSSTSHIVVGSDMAQPEIMS